MGQDDAHTLLVLGRIDGHRCAVRERAVKIVADIQTRVARNDQIREVTADIFGAEAVGTATQRHNVQRIGVLDEIEVGGDDADHELDGQRFVIAAPLAVHHGHVFGKAALETQGGAVAHPDDEQRAPKIGSEEASVPEASVITSFSISVAVLKSRMESA